MSILFYPRFFSPSFLPIFLRSDSTSSIHLSQGLPFLLPPPGLPSSNFVTVLVPSNLTACPNFQSAYFNYSYNIWRVKFVIHFLIQFYSPVIIFVCWSIYFLSIFIFHIIKTLSILFVRVHDLAP